MENFVRILSQIFPCRSEEVIRDVIGLVQQDSEDQNEEVMLEAMVSLLLESGDSTLSRNNVDVDEFEDLASGYTFNPPDDDFNMLDLDFLEKMFPTLSPIFLKSYYEEAKNFFEFNDFLNELLKESNVLRASREDTIFEQFSDMLPDADPDFLREKAGLLVDKPETEIEIFLDDALTKREYPKKQDYFKRQKLLNDLKIYTSNFTVDAFLEIIPDPLKHFYAPDYKPALDSENVSESDVKYAITILEECFPYIRHKDIMKVYEKSQKNLVKSSDVLARIPRFLQKPRVPIFTEYECKNAQLLQELAYIQHKQEIKTSIKMKNEYYRIARAEAEKYNLLQTCQCCYFDGLLPEECYFCNKNCTFCKDCVAKGAEHVIGKGQINFPCLTSCDSDFNIATLKMVLDRKVFEPLFTKIQIEELKKANIDGLETCPFCDFSMILTEDDKVFKCQRIECMIESCRECRRESHVPLKCNEIEYDEDVKVRTYIENKMTEALVRTCYSCQKSFFKDSGCNKMTCVCGAKMCYVCGATNVSYSHFGEIAYNKCPLYTQNLNEFHAQRIRSSANSAKEALGVVNNPSLLKKDPTEGLEEYFNQLGER